MTNSCRERIHDQLQGRLEDIPNFVDYDSPDFCQQCHDGDECDNEHLDRYSILSVDKHTYYDVHLSTGGPADFFRVFMHDNGEVEHIEYHFQDWYDGAVLVLDGADLSDVEDWIRYQVYIEEMV